MTVYIIKEENKLKIIKVQPHQEAFFQEDYAGRILVRATSTLEALMKFQDLPDEVKYSDQEQSPQ